LNLNQTILPLIPYPQQINFLPGSFQWTSKILISINPNFKEINLFLDSLPAQIRPSITTKENDSQLKIMIDPSMSNEAYHLSILPGRLELTAAGAPGIFYALQTLLQLILAECLPEIQQITLPCLQIIDSPRFTWRGFMLDEARHFQGMQTVKDLLDWMAYFKLNVFHWHLTEDQGWRIEIKKYPKLIEVGANRPASQVSGFLGKKLEQIPHSGYYTQNEIKELIEYAADRHIQIVPEIEMPGHAQAALAAYPELGCTGGPYHVSPHWGIHTDILCPGKSGTTTFLQNVLLEVMDLFPGNHIHTGGDEAPKKRWRNCPDCLELARKSEVGRINDLQTILTNQISSFLQSHKCTLIGWNEMLSEDLADEPVVQYWVGREKTLLKHIRLGRKAILSNFSAYYLDHSYKHSPLDKVYKYEPVFSQLESSFHTNILGIEAPLWTEFVPSRARLDWQIFPRLLAVAETAWLEPGKKDLSSFHHRLPKFLQQMDAKKLGYALLSDANLPVYKRLLGPISLLQAGKGKRID
jgi:hexosaminidase